MNTEDIKQWMSDPSRMNKENMLDLKSLLNIYPCFTAARILYLKSLLNLNDLNFSNVLIRTAISVPDRRRLYYFIEGKKLPDYKVQPSIGLLETGGFSLIDRYLKNSTPELKVASEESDKVVPFSIKPKEQVLPEKATLEKNESISSRGGVEKSSRSTIGNEGLLLDYSKYLTSQPEVELSPIPMNGQDLIDRFLTESNYQEPLIKTRPSENVSEDISTILDSPEFNLPEDSFTETLARIYLKQKRYDRAIEIFKSLSLKYPEKNIYFADQIRFLEKLIENIKK